MKKKKLGIIPKILIAVFAAVFGVSAFMIGKYWLTAHQEQKTFDELAAIVSEHTPTEGAAETKPEKKASEKKKTTETKTEPLPEYEPIYELNPDYYGWLKIDGTGINYPVMYTPRESEYYLHRDFYGNYSSCGMLFIDGECRTDSNYLLIYGHHMNTGAMFGILPSYGSYSFWQSYPVIHFDTRFEKGEYTVFAAFYSKIYDEKDTTHFKYYQWKDLSDENSFNSYIANIKSLSAYDTGITPVYGDSVITLSTCNYHTENGRFVVAAVKRKNE